MGGTSGTVTSGGDSSSSLESADSDPVSLSGVECRVVCRVGRMITELPGAAGTQVTSPNDLRYTTVTELTNHSSNKYNWRH